MKYNGTFENLKEKGFTQNIRNTYFYKIKKNGDKWGVIFVDNDTREISYDGSDIQIGQEILDEILEGQNIKNFYM